MTAPTIQFKRGAFVNLPGLQAGEPGFTTDKYDLYVGLTSETSTNKFFGSHRYWDRENGTLSLKLKLVDKDGINSIDLKSPNTLAGIVTFVLPGTQGATSSVLTNDGSGNLTWDSGSANPVFTGIATFSDTTDNTLGDANSGAVQIDGGVGINKNVTVGGNLNVQGYSEFVGVVTFKGGTINIGDDTGDNINIGGEFTSGLYPNTTNTYDLGDAARQWRNSSFAGVGTFTTGLVAHGVRIGISGTNIIDTTTGKLTLNSSTGIIEVSQHLDILGDLDVTGNVYIGGTTVVLRGTDVFIENKDIVLGYTTSITPNDTTANHAGVAIASTEGTPLVSFTASGINTLPDTYKQMMWFQSGTLGFGTDVFAFNYGVAIGTTTMADGVRLAVGSNVTVTDTTVSAPVGNFTTLSGSLTGTISTATRATTVDTTTAPSGTYYPALLTSSTGTTSAVVNVDAGISYVSNTDTLTLTGDIAVNGGDVTTSATTFNLINETATNVNFGGAATALVMGAATGITTVSNNLTVAGDIKVGGNDIQASDGNANITLTSNTLTAFAGDIKVGGNDLQASDGTTAITLSSADVTIAGDLQITGNDIKSSTGAVAITLSTNDVTIADDLTVGGNLYVNGNTTQVNTAALTVEDRTIELGRVDGLVPSSATTWDLGVLFNYNASGAKKSAVIWENTDSRFKFASVLVLDTDGTDVNTPQLSVSTFAPIEIGSLWVTDCAGTSQVISCTGSTRNLENITVDAGTF